MSVSLRNRLLIATLLFIGAVFSRGLLVDSFCASAMSLGNKQVQLGIAQRRRLFSRLSPAPESTVVFITALTLQYGVDSDVRSVALDIIEESKGGILLGLSSYRLKGGHISSREIFTQLLDLHGRSMQREALSVDWSRSIIHAIETDNFTHLEYFLHPVLLPRNCGVAPHHDCDLELLVANLLVLAARISSPVFSRVSDAESLRLLRIYTLQQD
jgi:hypothetical protein